MDGLINRTRGNGKETEHERRNTQVEGWDETGQSTIKSKRTSGSGRIKGGKVEGGKWNSKPPKPILEGGRNHGKNRLGLPLHSSPPLRRSQLHAQPPHAKFLP